MTQNFAAPCGLIDTFVHETHRSIDKERESCETNTDQRFPLSN